jgi:hypothetical protein
MKKGSCVLLLFVLISSAQRSFGTAVLVLRSRNTIWIAADSMESDQYLKSHRSACKISSRGQFYWAASGPLYSDPQTGFDVSALMARIKFEDGNLRSKMDTFLSKSKHPFARELAAVKRASPATYSKFLTYQYLLQIIFVGFENGQPTWTLGTLTGHEVNGQITIDDASNEAPFLAEHRTDVQGIGETREAREYLNNHHPEVRNDPVAALRESVLIEERALPQEVGGKVSILEISGIGTRWVEKGECK